MEDIKFLKLKCGYDIISECDEIGNLYRLTMPAMVVITQQGVGIAEFIPLIDEESIYIDKSEVLFVGTPKFELKNIYNEKFGSGIVAASPAQSRIILDSQ